MKFFPILLSFTFFQILLFAQAPDSWLQKTSLPGAPRQGAVAFVIHQFGYVGTGEDSAGRLLKDFWRYDPGADAWTQVADFAGTARKNAVAFSLNDTGYVGTGQDSAAIRKDFYLYNALINSWSPIDDMDTLNGASSGKRDAAAFTIGSRAYLAAGYDGSSQYSRTTWEFDAFRDTSWFRKLDFPAGRRWVAAFSIGNSGFVCLGFSPNQHLNNDVWRYDPVLNAWSQMSEFPGTLRAGAAGFTIGNKGYVGSGFDGSLTADFYSYTYSTNSWAGVAPLPSSPTTGAAAFSINGKGYFFGGSDTAGCKNELWEYTPDSVVGISPVSNFHYRVSLYPNPVSSLLQISNAENGKLNFSLYDNAGNLVLEKTLNENRYSLPVGHLASGIYYYRISVFPMRAGFQVGKIIVQ